MVRDSLLFRTSRPIQYLNHEVNAVRRRIFPDTIIFALAFPDTYELGMSNLGLKILYHILNGREGVSGERVFAPEPDMEDNLRRDGTPLSTLESGTPLHLCQIIGFTLQSELHYTGILNMLDMGGVPLRTSQRRREDPLVLGGGPLAFNPEPLADFIDAFALGDGEDVVLEIEEAYRSWRRESQSREILMERLASIPGVYVPSLYRVSYDKEGRVGAVEPLLPGVPEKVTRRLVRDLDRSPYPEAPPVPFLDITHDRLTVEVSRGCPQGCRFCHAGMVYRPYRERSSEKVEKIVLNSLARTGYDTISLSALSIGDYCPLPSLARRLSSRLGPRHISISLPSIRPGSLPDDVIVQVGSVRKSSFTIAPEAATERLRKVINKGITEEEILGTADYIFRNGWSALKLYFMIGLPTETEEDVREIVDLASRIRATALSAGVRKPRITVSVSAFVPKTHTPFQWAAMAGLDNMEKTIHKLQGRLRKGGFNFKWHHPSMSMIEGLLARGDRRLGPVIHEVWKRGGRLEAWTDHFDLSRWRESLAVQSLGPEEYLHRERDEKEIFPWDHLDVTVRRSFLWEDYRRALGEKETPPCRTGHCRICGACPDGLTPPPEELLPPPAASMDGPSLEDRRFRVRIRFRKEGVMKFLSHLELFRCFHRASLRASLPLSYTAGFNPHPRIAFAPPLPVGYVGEREMADLELASPFTLNELIWRMNRALPEGLEVTAARFIPKGVPSLNEDADLARFSVDLPSDMISRKERIGKDLEALLEKEELLVERKKKGVAKPKNVRPFIHEASLLEEGNNLRLDLWLKYTREGSIRPAELMEALFRDGTGGPGEFPVRRLGIYRLEREKAVEIFFPPRIPRLGGRQESLTGGREYVPLNKNQVED
jgi:radical SAM family uncharacterized protein/radical SAM-linked protein